MTWREVLTQAGVSVDVLDSAHVRLTDHDTTASSIVYLSSSTDWLRTSRLPTPPERPALLVLPRATAKAIDEARSRGWYVVTDEGDAHLTIGERSIEVHAKSPQPPTRRPSTRTWSHFTVSRVVAALAAGADGTFRATQSELARLSGVSQPTVHRTLKQLRELDLIDTRRPSGTTTVHQRRLITWWLAHYPGPGGLSTHWYGLDQPRDHLHAISSLVAQAASDDDQCTATRVLVSGEMAADAIAPWQRPSTARVYTDGWLPLARAGFVPVDSAEAANLTVTVPADPGVWPTNAWLLPQLGAHLEAADPLQILHDLERDDASTAAEARERLIDVLVHRLSQRWRSQREDPR